MKKLLSVIISLTLLTLFFTQFVFAENDGVVETKNILSHSILTKKMSKDIAPAYRTYIKERGYSSGVNVDEYWLDLWSDFTRDINAGLPIHTDLQADDGGHSVVTVGWYMLRYGSTDFRYLQVINGWNKVIKYLSFDGYYKSINGIAIKL